MKELTTKQLKQLSKLNVLALRCLQLHEFFKRNDPIYEALFIDGINIQKDFIKSGEKSFSKFFHRRLFGNPFNVKLN